MKNRRFVLVALSMLACTPAFGVINSLDAVPAATLLLPYFEVDIANVDGVDTVFTINNASPMAVLAHVTLWTDQSVPGLDFDVYLTGYDTEEIDLREIFANGNLPVTAPAGEDPKDTISPQGPVSEDVGFAGCSSLPYSSSFLSAAFRAHLQAWFQGNQSPVTGNCAGSKQQDNILRGYVTVDTVSGCNLFYPSDWAFYAQFLTNQNVLWGDYVIVIPALNAAEGETLVHIEACPNCFGPGDHTFYGRYNAASGADGREPLPTWWATRYGSEGTSVGGTDLLVWREANAAAGGYGCSLSGPPSWYPLQHDRVVIFDEEEQAVVLESSDVHQADPAALVNAASRIAVGDELPAPFSSGWLVLELNWDWVSRAQSLVVFDQVHRMLHNALPFPDTPDIVWPTEPLTGNCWLILGWLDNSNQPAMGEVGDHALLIKTSCKPAPSGYGWLQPIWGPSDLYVEMSVAKYNEISGWYCGWSLLDESWKGDGTKPYVESDMCVCYSCDDQDFVTPF